MVLNGGSALPRDKQAAIFPDRIIDRFGGFIARSSGCLNSHQKADKTWI